MKKLKLDLNELQVLSFDPQPLSGTDHKGTVFGFENLDADGLPTVDGPSCSCGCNGPSDETCGEWTCLLSCAVTC